MTSRRGFLAGLLAAAAAPAIVRAESLMQIWVPPEPKIVGSTDEWTIETWNPGQSWKHVAYSMSGGVLTCYINGVRVATPHELSVSLREVNDLVVVDVHPAPPSQPIALRITRGVDRMKGHA